MTRDEKTIAAIVVGLVAIDYLKKRAIRQATHKAADTFGDLLKKLQNL